MTNRDREHAARMLEKAEEIRALADRGRFRSDLTAVERVHLRAIFIAEYSDHLSRGFKDKNPTLWATVRNFRTAVLHTYETIDPEDLWRFIRDDLPKIVSVLRKARFTKDNRAEPATRRQ
jgi:uncharacterized protein with HEPN domain